jgi:hypothetical protein
MKTVVTPWLPAALAIGACACLALNAMAAGEPPSFPESFAAGVHYTTVSAAISPRNFTRAALRSTPRRTASPSQAAG